MKKLAHKYKSYLSNREFVVSFVFGLALLFLSFYINFRAGSYATSHESNSVTDIILSNIRVYNVDAIFTEGSILFWIFVLMLGLISPEKIPYTLKSIALFVLIRSVFISLTHIGPFPTSLVIDSSDFVKKFSFGGDLFFSGHTGLPFLMALIFWEHFYLRVLFIASSILFGVVVLMAHLHYSIAVMAAFFITYTINHMAEVFFKKDRKLFKAGLPL